MSLIQVRNLSFRYDGSSDYIFDHVSFQIDTNWKLGFISRNGRGKTTFLRLLSGAYPFQGAIDASVTFHYFPYDIADIQATSLQALRDAIAPFSAWEAEMDACLARGDADSLQRYGSLQELMIQHDGYLIDELITREANKLGVAQEALQRPWDTLSHGERTKLQIAALFLKKRNVPLIDEPTNHLDMDGRKALAYYLSAKKGFILVSHDRMLLDSVVDHVLSINRANIEIQRGNYTSWKHNRDMQDQYEADKNAQLKTEIRRLIASMRQTAEWSDAIEATKIGTHMADRGYVGAQSARMMKRSKAIEHRTQSAIDEKTQLLQNIETSEPLKLQPLPYHKKRLLETVALQIDYGAGPLFAPVSFTLSQGERMALIGKNGSGKSSILRLLLGDAVPHSGQARLGERMTLSFVSQDTAHLHGLPRAYAMHAGIDLTLFLTILRKLDFARDAFDQPMETYSAGQKKKVLLAASLATPAHLYIWDEPLNYIDVLSRVQIEALLTQYDCTMIFVEHDRRFVDAVATSTIMLSPE